MPPAPAAGDRCDRPAQPLALLVRPRRGQIVIADVGQNRYGGDQRRPRRPTTAGRAARACTPTTSASPRCDGVPATCRCSTRPTAPGLLRDRRRLRRPRPGPADAARPLHLRRLLRGAAALGRPDQRGHRRARRLSIAGSTRSARTAAAASSSSRSTGRCIAIVDGTATPCGGPTPSRRRPRRRPRAQPDADAESDAQPEPEPVAVAEPIPDAEPVALAEPVAVAEPDPLAEPDTVAEPDAVPDARHRRPARLRRSLAHRDARPARALA